MRNWLALLSTLCVGTTLSLSAMDSRTWVAVEADYRHDQLNWEFKAPSPDPLIESNIHFRDIHIFQIGVAARTVMDCNVMLRAEASYGWVLDGDVSETLRVFGTEVDEIETCTEAKSCNILDGRYVADLSIGIGYPFYFCDCTVSFTPVIGYAYSSQYYAEDRNNELEFDPLDPGATIVEDEDVSLRNKYVSRWYGPFIGIDLGYSPDACLSLYAEFEYHFAHWKGKRDSDVNFELFDCFDRASHHAHGAVVAVGLNYMFCDCWFIGLNAEYQDWSAHKSVALGNEMIEEGFMADDPENHGLHFRTNVDWRSIAFGFNVGKCF